MEYKVSVIVPVYKAEKYINECVESLIEQTLDSLEIILLDDGSPDKSGEICDQWALKHENVFVYHLENGGPSRARNVGLNKANGKYVGFVDSDDYVSKDMFKTLYEEAEKNNANIVMCSYAIDNGEDICELVMNYKSVYDGREEIIEGLSTAYSRRYHSGLYSVCNKLFDNNLLQSNNISFDEKLVRAEDAWFVFDCLKISNKVCFVNKVLYYYRQIQTSTMHMIKNDRYERSKTFRKKLINECNQLNISIDNNEFYYDFLYEAFIYCRYMVKQGDGNMVNNVLNDDFFYEACRYRKHLPVHLKWLCCIERRRLYEVLKSALKIWVIYEN